MKKLSLVVLVLSVSLSTLANTEVPEALADLIPAGSDGSIRMSGGAKDGSQCEVELSNGAFGFGATVYVYNDDDQLVSNRLAKFQIGLGHKLVGKVKETMTETVAVSEHKAEESYSSDTRSTLTVSFDDDVISSVSVKVEKSGFFGYREQVNESCRF